MNKFDNVINFDHHSKAHTRNWVETYRHLRATCPIARTESHGGYWVVTRFDDVVAVAQDTENFTKRKWRDENGVWRGGGTIPTISGLLIPDDIDWPEWKAYRHLLNPWFTPKVVARTRAMAERSTPKWRASIARQAASSPISLAAQTYKVSTCSGSVSGVWPTRLRYSQNRS